MSNAPVPTEHLPELTLELDRVKSRVFMDKLNAAFLGSIMCSLEFVWSRELPTAGTDAKYLIWNPDYFNKLPGDSRKTDLSHELWHVALLHQVRKGSREHELWNIACDIKIDWILKAQGHSFAGIDSVLDHEPYNDPKYQNMAEEDIYDDLLNNKPPSPKSKSCCTCCSGSLPATTDPASVINVVVQAVHQATLANQAGNLPGAVKQNLKKFLDPIIPWQSALMKFFTDLIDDSYSWARPNRRHQDIYLPSRFEDEGRLDHLAYFLDVSMSVTDQQLLRFNSEVKYIQEVLKPKRLTLIQFDTIIQDVKEFKEEDPFSEIEIIGRGGTSFVPVRQWIIDNEPSAAVVFSDMYCDPMQKLPNPIPIIWVVMSNTSAKVPFGTMIHINN